MDIFLKILSTGIFHLHPEFLNFNRYLKIMQTLPSKIPFRIFITILSCLFFNTSCTKEVSELYPSELKCESRMDPLGIDEQYPRLSWILMSNERGQKQTTFQILVATTKDKLDANDGDLWNSGKVKSSESMNIDYSGKKLESRMICYWKVRVWDKDKNVSAWSTPAHWEMSLLAHNDWKANWIKDGKEIPANEEGLYDDDPAPLFRKTFESEKAIKRARLYISGLGYYLAYLNGIRIGDHELDPAWTTYSKRIFYSTYDVTKLINNGSNCLGVTLGNGWYNPLPLRMWGRLNLREHLTIGRPCLISQLYIEYTDGSELVIVSDKSWKVHDGPLVRNNIYIGEVYDAQKEVPGWNKPNLNESDWKFVAVAPNLSGILRAQHLPPIKITKTIIPSEVTEPSPGVYIVDMGQNFAGTIRLKVTEPPGNKITLRYGELLNEDGTLNPMTSVAGQIKGKRRSDGQLMNVGGPGSPEIAWQVDRYITKGGGIEKYIPRFTFHGFRYVEITGLESSPDRTVIEGLRMNSSIESAGSFSCSDTLLNRIQEMCQWTFLSNIFGVQSDCPHREKFGYGGDIAATSEAFIFNFDMAQFYSKAVNDWSEAAFEDGMFTDTAPFVGIQYCGVAWAMAHPILQLQLYKYYGNKRLLEEQYAASKRWFYLVISDNPDYLIQEGLSDHEGLTEKPEEEMITPLYYYTAKIMAEIAYILDFHDDVERYRELAQEISDTYCRKFFNEETGKVGPGTQATQAFALFTGITPPEFSKKILDYLVRDITENHNFHLSTGIFGTRYMMDLLSKYGYHQLAVQIARQKDFPGWGNMIENGATTLWEHWEFSDNTYSHNHPMFGSISQWFYNRLGGIQVDPEAIGFNKIIINLETSGPITWVKCNYQSVQGMIVSNWEKTHDGLNMNINIPPNTSAIIYFPAEDPTQIEESGIPLNEATGITVLGIENGKVKCRAGSGNYLFNIS